MIKNYKNIPLKVGGGGRKEGERLKFNNLDSCRHLVLFIFKEIIMQCAISFEIKNFVC